MTEDKKLEELKMISHDFCLLYQSIYETMGFVEGQDARTSATATVFISTKDEWKSIEYERKQEARKHPTQPPAAPSVPKVVQEQRQKTATQSTGPPEPPKTKPPEGQETIEGEPAYDRLKLHWMRCPRCGNTEIDAETEKTNKRGEKYVKRYQVCFGDIETREHPGIFLNADGKTVEMQPREAK